jgi:DNA repair exonuclease SbcCD ATPase subunit
MINARHKQPMWAARSQASILREEELRQRRATLAAQVARLERKVAELEGHRSRHAKQLRQGEHYLPAVRDNLAELREARDLLQLHQEQVEALDQEIIECGNTQEEVATREQNQHTLAALAGQRLAVDEKIDQAAAELRKLLHSRSDLTANMKAHAAAIEMELDLDQDRFDALAEALPDSIADRSKAWLDWLFGKRQGLVRAVARERVVLPETLAHSGAYQLGEEIELSAEEFAELHRADRRDPTHEEPWKRRPASVFTMEEFEAAKAEAKRKSIGLEEVVFWQNMAKWAQDRDNFAPSKVRS